jgi:uncharacterized membrane protein YcaP (DUF421 family)
MQRATVRPHTRLGGEPRCDRSTAGIAALVVPIGLQCIVSLATSRSHRWEQIINGRPTLRLLNGGLCHEMMRKYRLTDEEVRAAIRKHGLAPTEDANAVVLGTNGDLQRGGRRTRGRGVHHAER